MDNNELKALKACFKTAEKEEKKGRKHKGILIVSPDGKSAQEYVQKAKINLNLCEMYKQNGFDYKIPEEWFYTLYYCALAVLSKFGVETRSQRYTAIFLKYVKSKNLISYDDEFINRITVYAEKEEKSEVDERELSRYSSSIKNEKVTGRYEEMMQLCRRAISQAEEIVFSDNNYRVPEELYK